MRHFVGHGVILIVVLSSGLFSGGAEDRSQLGIAVAAKPDNTKPQEKEWPLLFLLGVQKGGSTSVAKMLWNHPQICASKALLHEPQWMGKEPHFFDKKFSQGVSRYLAGFKRNPKCSAPTKSGRPVFAMDATPSYINDPRAIQRMGRVIPARIKSRLKFIVVLREPVSRDLSWFNQHRAVAQQTTGSPSQLIEGTGFTKMDFDGRYQDFVAKRFRVAESGRYEKSVFRGLYYKQLRRIVKVFSRSQILVLSMHTLLANFTDTVDRMANFLELEREPWNVYTELPRDNEKGGSHKVTLEQVALETCQRMRAFFDDDTEKLYRLLQRPGWPPQQPPFAKFKPPCPKPSTAATGLGHEP